jgi:hypothetical protein
MAFLGTGTAVAKNRSVTFPLPRVVGLKMDGQERNGYRLDLYAEKIFPLPEQRRGKVNTILALLASRGAANASYFPKATIEDGEIRAGFGPLGEVAAHFEPSGPRRTEPVIGCKGAKLFRERGWIVGRISFHGEHGYTQLVAMRLPGSQFERRRQSCTVHLPTTRRGEGKRVTLEGLTRHGHSTVTFSAERDRPGAPARLSAETTERLGGVSISRSVEVKGGDSSFIFDTALTKAEVHPPVPFQGSALFATPTPNRTGTWLGSLSVSFPGRPDVRLAGDDFRGSLVGGSHCPFDPDAACFEISAE